MGFIALRGPFLEASYLFLEQNALQRPAVCSIQAYRSITLKYKIAAPVAPYYNTCNYKVKLYSSIATVYAYTVGVHGRYYIILYIEVHVRAPRTVVRGQARAVATPARLSV